MEVDAVSIDTFNTLTVEDESGKRWEFKGGFFAGFTPSHLLSHRAEREPVEVTYREEPDGTLKVVKIEDG